VGGFAGGPPTSVKKAGRRREGKKGIKYPVVETDGGGRIKEP